MPSYTIGLCTDACVIAENAVKRPCGVTVEVPMIVIRSSDEKPKTQDTAVQAHVDISRLL